MQSPPDSKSTPALMAYGRLCQWLPTDHDIHRIHEVQLGFQERVVRLMFAVRFLRLYEWFLTSLAKIASIRAVWLFSRPLLF